MTMSKYDDESVTASNQWDRYIRARDNGHLDYIEMAKKCDSYYRGEQWDEADIAALDAEGRPALTINTILPTINTVLGEQSTRHHGWPWLLRCADGFLRSCRG